MARTGAGTRRTTAKTAGSAEKPATDPVTEPTAGHDLSSPDSANDASRATPETAAEPEPEQSEQMTQADASPVSVSSETSDAAEPPAADTAPSIGETSGSGTTPTGTATASGALLSPVPKTEPPATERRGGLVPLVLGGMIAAAIGAGAALYFFPQGWQPADTASLEARLATLEARAQDDGIAVLADRLTAMETAIPDLQPLEDRLAALESGGDLLAPLEDRLRQLEGSLSERIEAEIAGALEAAREGQAAQAQAIETAQQDLAAAQTRLEARAAIAQLAAAAENGAPAPDALPPIAALTDLPPAMETFRTGLPQLRALQSSFPAAARDALAAAPVTEDSSAADRLMRFLRSQTGARSLIPRDGTDTDAILSRAEAHLRTADLPATLAELDTLPEAPAAALAEWRRQAEARLAALAALAEVQARIDTQ